MLTVRIALQDFDKQVKAALSKGKALSASTVSAISKLALTNMEVSPGTSGHGSYSSAAE